MSKIDELCLRVSEAIRRAERLEDEDPKGEENIVLVSMYFFQRPDCSHKSRDCKIITKQLRQRIQTIR